jgi:hypothetical protein
VEEPQAGIGIHLVISDRIGYSMELSEWACRAEVRGGIYVGAKRMAQPAVGGESHSSPRRSKNQGERNEQEL